MFYINRERVAVTEVNASTSIAPVSKAEALRRAKEYHKADIETITARYDSEIAELQRTLERQLCDLSCTQAQAKRLRAETAKRVRVLTKNRRRALRLENADNKRFNACLKRKKLLGQSRKASKDALGVIRANLLKLLDQRDEVNAKLLSIYMYDSYKSAKKFKTPWHKTFIRAKKRWQKKCRRQMYLIDSMNLSHRDKQKLRSDIDRLATTRADIAAEKCRAKKMRLKGLAKRQHKRELVDMREEVVRAEKNLKRSKKAARAKEDRYYFWHVSMISLAITVTLVVAGVLIWKAFGADIVNYLNEHFPDIMSQLK